MAETKIEWANFTFNPWMGCTKVSPACLYCYAERDMADRYRKVNWGPAGNRVLTATWQQPFKWNAEAGKEGTRPRVFCASLADVFEDWQGGMMRRLPDGRFIPLMVHRAVTLARVMLPKDQRIVSERPMEMQDARELLFQVIDQTPNLEWLLLTKRPENIERFWDGKERGNVRFGCSVENQHYADERIPYIIEAADKWGGGTFISAEPLVGPVDITGYAAGLDWVVTGGESGPEGRPADPGWFRDLRDQCLHIGCPFLFKQWGEWGPDDLHSLQGHQVMTHNPAIEGTPAEPDLGKFSQRVARWGKKLAGRELDGQTWDQFDEPASRSN